MLGCRIECMLYWPIGCGKLTRRSRKESNKIPEKIHLESKVTYTPNSPFSGAHQTTVCYIVSFCRRFGLRSHGQNSNGLYTLNTSHVHGNAVQPLVRHSEVKTQISTGASAMEHRQVIFMLLLIWRTYQWTLADGAYYYIIRQCAIKNICVLVTRKYYASYILVQTAFTPAMNCSRVH